MRTSVYKRAASLLICVAFLLSVTFVKPQKADAIAITGTAAVVASVAAIMTACGVTYWAASEQDAIDYLGGKIEDYLTAAGSTASDAMEWLGIDSMSDLFMVIQGGALSFPRIITNKILDFIRWFNQEEGVTSGGQEITGTNGSSLDLLSNKASGTITSQIDSLSSFTLSFDAVKDSSDYGYVKTVVGIPVSNGQQCQVVVGNFDSSLNSLNIRWGVGFNNGNSLNVSQSQNKLIAVNATVNSTASDNTLCIVIDMTNVRISSGITGSVTFNVNFGGSLSQSTNVITPSASVSVPSDLEVGQSLVVTTTAPIQSDDDVEAASEAILGEIASEEGLDANNATEGEAVPSAWTWLYNVVRGLADTVENIFDAILDLPVTIANAIKAALVDLFVPDEAFIDAYVATLYANFDNHFSILSYPFSLLGTFITKVATAGSSEPIISWPNIYEHFSGRLLIAAGSYNLNSILANQAIANMYAIYMIVIKAIISFQFVAFLYAWFCDVFHMRNSDFDNPYDLASGGDIDDS